MKHFTDLELSDPILRALEEEGYEKPTDIQLAAIPMVLSGGDLLATAQTGTGKTAAFALPILHRLDKARRRDRDDARKGKKKGTSPILVLVLTPTRELALQIDESFRTYGRHLQVKTAVAVGGVPKGPQIKALRRGPEVLVATPGRLLDLFTDGLVRLDRLSILVLDEADRMLDMGFINDVRKIVAATPSERQTLFFSATLPLTIARFASSMLRDPSMVAVTPAASVSDNIEQNVMFVERRDKPHLLMHLLKNKDMDRVLIFTRTKHRAEAIMRSLVRDGILADAIHSNKTQKARQQALGAFDKGKVRVLVATDIVARGIDVESISHVINYELPNDTESYIHRIGRTARAGKVGTALSFCDFEEVHMLKDIEKLTQRKLETNEDHPFHADSIARLARPVPGSSRSRMRRRPRSRRRRAA